ncbi:MAG TPA: hypothetical protein DCY03_06565 [Planctomycetaceae bacterium]|nr:hypothetical protein [Planctomycetaceae bacterium]
MFPSAHSRFCLCVPLLRHRAQTDIKRRLVCHDNSDLKAGEMMDLIDRMKDIASRIPKQMEYTQTDLPPAV